MEVAGIEPDTPCAETPVKIKDSDFSPEALIKILTKIPGTDRQMLTQIVERWGSLSYELKRAIFEGGGGRIGDISMSMNEGTAQAICHRSFD